MSSEKAKTAGTISRYFLGVSFVVFAFCLTTWIPFSPWFMERSDGWEMVTFYLPSLGTLDSILLVGILILSLVSEVRKWPLLIVLASLSLSIYIVVFTNLQNEEIAGGLLLILLLKTFGIAFGFGCKGKAR